MRVARFIVLLLAGLQLALFAGCAGSAKPTSPTSPTLAKEKPVQSEPVSQEIEAPMTTRGGTSAG